MRVEGREVEAHGTWRTEGALGNPGNRCGCGEGEISAQGMKEVGSGDGVVPLEGLYLRREDHDGDTTLDPLLSIEDVDDQGQDHRHGTGLVNGKDADTEVEAAVPLVNGTGHTGIALTGLHHLLIDADIDISPDNRA